MPLPAQPLSGGDRFRPVRDEPTTAPQPSSTLAAAAAPPLTEASELGYGGEGGEYFSKTPPPPLSTLPEAPSTQSGEGESKNREGAAASTQRQAPPPAPPPSARLEPPPRAKSGQSKGSGRGDSSDWTMRESDARAPPSVMSTTPMNGMENLPAARTTAIASSGVPGSNHWFAGSRLSRPDEVDASPYGTGDSRGAETAKEGGGESTVASRVKAVDATSAASFRQEDTVGPSTGRVHEKEGCEKIGVQSRQETLPCPGVAATWRSLRVGGCSGSGSLSGHVDAARAKSSTLDLGKVNRLDGGAPRGCSESATRVGEQPSVDRSIPSPMAGTLAPVPGPTAMEQVICAQSDKQGSRGMNSGSGAGERVQNDSSGVARMSGGERGAGALQRPLLQDAERLPPSEAYPRSFASQPAERAPRSGRSSPEARCDGAARSMTEVRAGAMKEPSKTSRTAAVESEPRGVLDVPQFRTGLRDSDVDFSTRLPSAEGGGSCRGEGKDEAGAHDRADFGDSSPAVQMAAASGYAAQRKLNRGGMMQPAKDGPQESTDARPAPPSTLGQAWVPMFTAVGPARDSAQRTPPGIARGSADYHTHDLVNRTVVTSMSSDLSPLGSNELRQRSTAVNSLTADAAIAPVVSQSGVTSTGSSGQSFPGQLLSRGEAPRARLGIHTPATRPGMSSSMGEEEMLSPVGRTPAAGAGLAVERASAPRPNGDSKTNPNGTSKAHGSGAATDPAGAGPHRPRFEAADQTPATAVRGMVLPWGGTPPDATTDNASVTRGSSHVFRPGGKHSEMQTHAGSAGGATFAHGPRPLGSHLSVPSPIPFSTDQDEVTGVGDFSLFSTNGGIVSGKETGSVGELPSNSEHFWRSGVVLPPARSAAPPTELGVTPNNGDDPSLPLMGASAPSRGMETDPTFLQVPSRTDEGTLSGHRGGGLKSPPSVHAGAPRGNLPARHSSHFGRRSFGRPTDSALVSFFPSF